VGRVLILVGVLLGLFTAVAAFGATAIQGDIDDSDTVVLRGNVPHQARPEFDAGAADTALPMERMILSLYISPQKQGELAGLLADQQDPSSQNFHKWLTPEEFGARFGAAPADIRTITHWLTSHGFKIDETGKGGTWVNFSGRVAEVEKAFHVTMRTYRVEGTLRHANANDPAIPRALTGLVAGVVSLHDFPRRAMHIEARPVSIPEYSSGSTHYLAPGDFATIYNVNALYAAGIDGTGQSIAIVGRTHPSGADWSAFRSIMALPANTPQIIVNGTDPGDLGGGEDIEANLDVEWAGAVAKNASIKFVTSKSTSSTDGVDLSAQYIVNNNLAAVMSTSFGSCEAQMTYLNGIKKPSVTENAFYNNLWSQAAAQGITSFVSSGDYGAAGCGTYDANSNLVGWSAGVNGIASTPYNVAVGGTQFNEGSGNYWSAGNGTGYASATGYLPEIAWNESGTLPAATGGGPSSIYAKPAWQVSPGVPADGMRDIPDVSLTSARHDGYLVCSQGSCTSSFYVVGGTSAASPSFAGLMALVVQQTGQRQGNANARLYQLANAQYGSGGVAVFHDTVSGNNSVPGVTGYSCTAGYDLATGLGSVDAYALVSNWIPEFAVSAAPSSLSVLQRSSGSASVTATLTGNFSSPVSLAASGLPAGATALFAPSAIAAPGAGSSTLTILADASTAAGSYPVVITATGGGLSRSATLNLNVIAVFDLQATVSNGGGGTISPAAVTVPSGGSATFTVAPGNGYHLFSLTDNGADVTSMVSNGSYTLTSVAAEHSIVAVFAITAYEVTASVPAGNGTVTPASGIVNFGGSVTFTFTPDAGYLLATLTDNGTAVTWVPGPNGSYSYTVSPVTSAHQITAGFAPLTAAPVPALPPFGIAVSLVLAGLVVFKLHRKVGE
jgi:pseudomonalisin